MSLRKLLIWFTNTKPYTWLLKYVIPYIRLTTYYPTFTGRQYERARRELQPGDIILCRDNKKLTTLLIGGEFSHAAMCVGYSSTGLLQVQEMTNDDCVRRMLFDTCKESDRVVILRPTTYDHEYTCQVIRHCRSYFNNKVKYDHEFKLGIKALSCAEMIWAADFERRLECNLEDIKSLGRLYISPDGLYKAKNVRKIYDSNEL